MTLGRLAYHTYFRPKARLAAVARRGLVNSWIDDRGHRQMRAAAGKLRCPEEAGREEVRVHFLTGARFWHQTAFCAWSLATTARVNVTPILHDDGSLDGEVVEILRQILPRTEVVSAAEADAALERCLPRTKYPSLRGRRDVYPNLKKLLDVHAGQQGWKLVLDSDMLFFREPTVLLNWLRHPDRPCHMVDSETSYGYPLDFLSDQCGGMVQERVNVGITGLCSEMIPWDELERWTAEQNTRFGPHYYQEQALIAQLVARSHPLVVDAEDYKVQPAESEVRAPRAILHHYVAAAKPWYYRYGWRHTIKQATG